MIYTNKQRIKFKTVTTKRTHVENSDFFFQKVEIVRNMPQKNFFMWDL